MTFLRLMQDINQPVPTMSSATKSSDLIQANYTPPPDHVSMRSWLAVFFAALGAFMAVLDIQITNSSMADIQGALGASIDEGTWISTSYLVAEIIVIPLTGWLAQVFSTKRYLLFNAALFIFFSMCCAWADSLQSMIICRALQGFTGGVLIPMAFNVILSTLPQSKRSVGMALFSVSATFAPAIGPTLGGWITENWGWQYIFYLNLIPGIIMFTGMFLTLPSAKMQLQLLKEGDWLGVITMALGLSSLEVVLEEGNRKDWFGSPLITQLAWVAGISLVTFIVRQLVAKKPLVNLNVFANRNFAIASIANTTVGAGLYGLIYLVPLYLTQVQGYNAQQIGQVLMWFGLPQLFITPFVPKLMRIIDNRLMIIIGLGIFALSCFRTSFMSTDFSGEQLVWSQLTRAIGLPLVFVPLSTMATAELEPKVAASASALYNMLRNLGGSVGIAIMSTLLTQRQQLHSVRIGESVTLWDPEVQQRIAELTRSMLARGADIVSAHERALRIIDHAVRQQSQVMAFNDCFYMFGFILLFGGFVVLFAKKIQAAQTSSVAH